MTSAASVSGKIYHGLMTDLTSCGHQDGQSVTWGGRGFDL